MRSDMAPGAVFPDYELPDHTAKRQRLSELQGQHPMVLLLSHGGYCRKDRRQHELLLQLHRELEVGYCRLVTISTDNITETNEYRSGVGRTPGPPSSRNCGTTEDRSSYVESYVYPAIGTWKKGEGRRGSESSGLSG
jgi:hypothetical protein